MSEAAERYRRLFGAFADKVAQVSPEQWDGLSPCEGWTPRDVVEHSVEIVDDADDRTKLLTLLGRRA